METTPESRSALGADHAELVDVRRRRRRQRVLVPVAARQTSPSRSRSSGASWRLWARPTRRAAKRYYASGEHHPGTDFIWGGGRLVDAWPVSPDDAQWDRVRTSEVETLVDQRRARLRDAAAGGHEGAPPVPAERQGGRAGGIRALDDLLDAAARGRHPADQHLPRHRPGRQVALRAAERRLHARGHADGARQGHRRRDGRPRAPDGPVAAVDGASRHVPAAATDARPARRCARCTRSCSAWAAGCSAP